MYNKYRKKNVNIFYALREWVINSKTLCWEGIFHCSSRYDWLPWIQLCWFSKPKLHLLSMPYSELKSILQNWFHLSISIVCPPSILNKVWKKRETRFSPIFLFSPFEGLNVSFHWIGICLIKWFKISLFVELVLFDHLQLQLISSLLRRMRGKFCVELVFVWSAPVLQLLS